MDTEIKGANKILFVDDEKGMHDIFRIFFKNETRSDLFQVEYFTSGLKCLNYLGSHAESEKYIVLTDITMPEMDGFELMKNLKQKYPQIPVIVISAYESPADIEKAKSLGALAYFTKPLEISELKDLIHTLINFKQ